MTNEDRVRNCDALNAILSEYFGQRSLDKNLELMDASGVTVGPVLSSADLVGHPYAVGRELFACIADAEMGSCSVPNPVPRLSRTPGQKPRPAPKQGEHTEAILKLIQSTHET